jgi:1-acyl-sn-glycerol-3-phosphate acyltransferase
MTFSSTTGAAVPSARDMPVAILWGAFTMFVTVGGFVLIPVLLLLSAYLYPKIVVPSFAIYYYWSYDGSEKKDGRAWPWFSERFFMFQWMRKFHNLTFDVSPVLLQEKEEAAAKLHESPPPHPNRQYIFAIHPHGCMSDFRVLMDSLLCQYLGDDLSVKTLGASTIFWFPPFREIALWTGCIDASRRIAERSLLKRKSILVIPGGEREQLMTTYGKERIYLKKRMGFVRLALKYGVPLVPVYVFGANDVYHTTSVCYNFRMQLVSYLQLCIPICWGPYGLPAVPLQVPLTIVFGDPIHPAKRVDPSADVSREEIAALHDIYMEKLTKLFDDNKVRLGYGDRTLIIE